MNNEYKNLKNTLDKFLAAKRQKEMGQGDERNMLVRDITIEVAKVFKPIMESMMTNSKMSKEELRTIAEEIAQKINIPEINIPEIVMPSFPEIRVPEPRVTVNVPKSEIPAPIVNIPDLMKVMGEVSMPGYDYKNPLPVLMMDSGGKPFQFSMGASGGKSDFFTIKGFGESAFSVPVNSEGQVPISGTIVTSAPDTTYVIPGNREGVVYNSDNPMPVTITSGASATTATNIVDSSGVAYSGSNPVPVVITSGASATTAVQNLNADGTYRDTFPVSGTVLVSDITASVKTALVDSSGVQYSGSNPVPISDAGGSITVDGTFWQATQPVSGTVTANLGTIADVATQTTLSAINAKLVTGTDIGDVTINNASGASAVNIQDGGNSITVDGTVTASNCTGNVAHDAADSGSPVKIGGVARTANPTAVANNDRVDASFDDLGRQIIRPVQMRDLTATAYVSKTSGSTFGTETTLFAGATNTYHDLIYVLASNDSTAAIGVDIRGTLAGNILMHLEIPANSTTGLSLPVPLPAGDVGASWTIDLPDVTGTNVYVSALFSKEV